MAVRGIRGATTTEEDSEAAIVDATIELLAEIARENTFDPGDLAAAWFTTTPDLTSEFPAAAARHLGWGDVPLLCAGTILILLPTLIIFVLFQRQIITALLQGSVKG